MAPMAAERSSFALEPEELCIGLQGPGMSPSSCCLLSGRMKGKERAYLLSNGCQDFGIDPTDAIAKLLNERIHSNE